MEFIRDIHSRCKRERRPAISFEFFPPKTEEGDRALFDRTMPELMKIRPDYSSVTYGAGGSTRDKTLGIVERIQKEFRLPSMAHLTCVGSTEAQLAEVLADAAGRGIRNILALRGDPPGGQRDFVKTEGGFEFSYELVRFIRKRGGFCIGTAGFPEGHIACREGREVDWQRLKNKIDCGADFVITQLFFDNADFLRFRDFLAKLGNTVSLIPGIIPILNATQIKKFTTLCGARIPNSLAVELENLGSNDEEAIEFGIRYATRQCEELIREGVVGLHFYTLNKPRSTVEVVTRLGLANPPS